MRCLVARYEHHTLRFPLPAAAASIGSSADNDITLPFPGVSRSHARLSPSEHGLLVRDLGSKNRIVVNGRAEEEAILVPGMTLQLGRASLSIEDASTSDLELALRTVARRRAGGPDTGTADDAAASERSSAGALALVRTMERAGERGIPAQRQQFIAGLRRVLGCDGVVLADLAAEDAVVLAADGEIAPVEITEDLRENRPRRKAEGSRVVSTVDSGCAVLAGYGRGSRVLVAHARREFAFEPWERDLFEYAVGRLLPDRSQEPPPPAARSHDSTLQIPEEMVIGTSEAMRGLLAHIEATVRSRMDVLLLGETGTGKELFARMIHSSGPSPNGPFVAINCAAIPNELLEAELFGVVGRVATGVDPRPGLFTRAHGGSIFLDEIGELAEPLQAKLLRVLQEREVLPLGTSTPRRIEVRVIAASNRLLDERVREGKFRADLFYRLRGLQFHIPPLRERKDDIPPLVLAFTERAAAEYGKTISGVSRKALALLVRHDWPGNVRELQSEVSRAVLLCPEGGALQSEHFSPVQWSIEHAPHVPLPEHASADDASDNCHLQSALDAVERQKIEKALARSRGNKSLAAKLLGITRNGLALKMQRLGISDGH
jgi:DNA-binding NtrC family response regulator